MIIIDIIQEQITTLVLSSLKSIKHKSLIML